MKTWQDRMKHEAECPALRLVRCKDCPHSGSLYCDGNPCPTVDVGCTCGRDAAVAAIEAVISEGGNVAKYGLKQCRCCPCAAINKLADALDRLNALGTEGGE